MKNKKKISYLQLITCVIYVSALMISNIVSSKQCLFPFGIVLGGGVFVFPITYILSDVFSEVYGYKWSRFTSWLSFSMNILMVLIFTVVLKWNHPDYWANQSAFDIVLGSTPRILVASLTAFIMGDWANDIVFKLMKSKHSDSSKGFGSRAIVSSIVGEFVDSLIFHPIAFLGVMPISVMINSIIFGAVAKIIYEIVCLPLTTLITKKVLKYERDAEDGANV